MQTKTDAGTLVKTAFKDINLQVGTKVQMTVHQGIRQVVCYTELLGYANEQYLIVRAPVHKGLDVMVRVDDRVTMRIFSGTCVIMFDCNVEAIFKNPYFYMLFSFPKGIQTQSLRCVIRVPVNFLAQINGLPEPVTIADISVAGAGIVADRLLGHVDEDIKISFILPVNHTDQNHHIEVKAEIRSIRPLPFKIDQLSPLFFYGVLFQHMDSITHAMLQNFVYESLYDDHIRF